MLSRRDVLLGASAVATLLPALSAAETPAARPSSYAHFDVERFIDDCKRASAVHTDDAQRAVQDVMARAMSNTHALLAGVGEPDKGGIVTLYRSPALTILNIVWSPLMQLIPHDHRMWAVIGIYTGREDNIFWQRRDGRLAAMNATAISEGSVVPLATDVIHSVSNPIEKLTGAIHIYGGDFFATSRSEWDPETLTERDWSIARALRNFKESNDRFFAPRTQTRCD
jgi:predicted metal-dependent enzyme (double-stranded beta helix superfamily)